MTNLTKAKIDFIDAQDMHIKHPKTFEAPIQDELDALVAGDCVMVSVMGERFWSEILIVDGEKIVARVDNDLVFTNKHGIVCDDVIKFEKRHIFRLGEPVSRPLISLH